MSGFNNAAYHQRHSASFAGPYAEPGDRFLCPHQCGRILSRRWFVDIYGVEPEDYLHPRVRFVDPSDDRVYSSEHRSPR